MPTYKNNTQNIIDLPYDELYGTRKINPGKTIVIEEIFTDAELISLNLTKISDIPYYNPLYTVQDIVSDSDLVAEVNINPLTKLIRIKEADVNIIVYFNSISNEPGYPISIRSLVNIESKRNIIKLYIVSSSAGSCQVMEFKG
jgi:hypothetical protein